MNGKKKGKIRCDTDNVHVKIVKTDDDVEMEVENIFRNRG